MADTARMRGLLAELGRLGAASAVEEVSQFISRRRNTGSTWSACSGSLRERIHDSFNLIGQMLILTVCVDISAERQKQYKKLFEDCQKAFIVWYDAHSESYAPAVQAFQALRGIIETSEGRLGAFELQTVKLLETDIDEIVSKIAEGP